MTKQQKINKAYIAYVTEFGEQPVSVIDLTKKLKLKEKDFYEYYNSFESLEKAIWLTIFEETIQKIEADEIYYSYSVREKLLAFYYTWIEVLKENRGFITYSCQLIKRNPLHQSSILKDFRLSYYQFIRDLVAEGIESTEVKPRVLITEKYPEVFWVQLLIVLDFWVKDSSEGYEKTDTLIEKAVNTSFDLIGINVLDSVFDFAKFLFQNR